MYLGYNLCSMLHSYLEKVIYLWTEVVERDQLLTPFLWQEHNVMCNYYQVDAVLVDVNVHVQSGCGQNFPHATINYNPTILDLPLKLV